MFDVLVREAAARFGVGDKALPLVQMLLASMTNKDTGGLAGFLEKFKAAGLGPIIQSWLGGGPSAQPITNSQIEAALGTSGGLLALVTTHLDLGRDNVASALTYLLPAIVGKLTPGGSIPVSLPPEVMALAATGHGLLAAPAATAAAPAAAGGGLMKWLPWAVVALAALVGLSYCSKNRMAEAPADAPALQAPASAPAPAASEPPPVAMFGGGAPAAAPEPAPASAPVVMGDMADEPTGSAVVARMLEDRPALNVYFDSGSTAVHADFAAKAQDVLEFLRTNQGAQAVISGYNDPTGNAAANAELSKNRAEAVQQALVALGVPAERTMLEKPAETTGTAPSNAASRRVEVVLRSGM